MSNIVAEKAAVRMLEHSKKHGVKELSITFHGGEPLLGGVQHIDLLSSIIRKVFANSYIHVTIGVQSNGLLFTPEIADLMLERGMTLGISIDGPPKVNDIYRVDRMGRPSSARLEEKLKLIVSDQYRKIFDGFLCVINIESDPLEVTKYLLSYNPPQIDFLLPDYNYDRVPPGKEVDVRLTPYADWLIRIFDYWFTTNNTTNIKLFNSIIRRLLGASSWVETIGLDPVQFVVIETNGSIEALDALKSTYQGATELGYNIFDNDFDVVARHKSIRNRQIGIEELCQKCKECPVVDICGGGYLPHRYSSERGFDNPSIYSSDLEKLIRHIHARLSQELRDSTIRMKQLNTFN